MGDTIDSLEAQIMEMKRRLVALRKQEGPEVVADHVLKELDGRDVRLSDLFGQHSDLILIHNMGRACNYCTLWADGFKGLVPHLETRAAFVLCSADPPEIAAAFAAEREWTFRVVSGQDSTLAKDLGFEDAPGVSTFVKTGEQLERVAKASFGPGDDFCPVWHFLELLRGGAAGWEPR